MPKFAPTLRRMRGWFVENWPIKLTALLLATLLWVVTATQEPTRQVVPVNLVVEPPEGRALRTALPSVHAWFVGSQGEVIKLYAELPTIHKTIPDSTSSEYTLEIGPDDLTGYPDAEVRPQLVQPSIISVRLDELRQRTVPVIHRVSIRPDSGFSQFGGIAVQPSSLIVRGPEARIRALDAVYTVPLEISGAQQTVRRSVAIDTSGLAPVRVSRNQVEIVAEIGPLSSRILSGVPVEVRDEQGGRWNADPDTVSVTLRGPTARVARLTLDSIAVVAFVRGRTNEQTAAVSVIAPSGIRAVTRPDSVTIRRRRG
jgi:hypothetical protein